MDKTIKGIFTYKITGNLLIFPRIQHGSRTPGLYQAVPQFLPSAPQDIVQSPRVCFLTPRPVFFPAYSILEEADILPQKNHLHPSPQGLGDELF